MKVDLKKLRDNHLKIYHQIELYDYQKELSDAIIDALFNVTDQKEPGQIVAEFSRQSGKTSALIHTVEILMLYMPQITGRKISIGIFAPRREQAKTDFDRLKIALMRSEKDNHLIPYEKNINTLILPNGAECYIFSVTPTSRPESKSLDLMIFEESHELIDHEIKYRVFPMGATTNAPRIFVGSGGYCICYFKRLIEKAGVKKFVYPYKRICEDRKKMYEKTKDKYHLMYKRYIESEKETLGEDSDEFKAPYELIWVLGTGQFVTKEKLDRLEGNFHRCHTTQGAGFPCYAGIDTAKDPDSTVVTVLRKDPDKTHKDLINWLELRGENYKDQFDIIVDFLKKYNTRAIAIDATGQGDFMPDMFERETQWNNEKNGLYRVKFNPVSKDIIYKGLSVAINESLTKLPTCDTIEAERFKQQMLDLQKEYKGQLLSCHHPQGKDAHDDYCDSWALAEFAYSQEVNRPEPDIKFI
jgi:hypothetical protein